MEFRGFDHRFFGPCRGVSARIGVDGVRVGALVADNPPPAIGVVATDAADRAVWIPDVGVPAAMTPLAVREHKLRGHRRIPFLPWVLEPAAGTGAPARWHGGS